MTNAVLTALGLDKLSKPGEFLVIEENGTADASFILSSIMGKHIKEKQKIILVLFHNIIGHYHAIGLKLGYNMFSLHKSKELVVVDGLKFMSSLCVDPDFSKNQYSLRSLLFEVKQHIHEMSNEEHVYLVIESISNLLLNNFILKEVSCFIHYIRTLMYENKNLSLVCLVHNIEDCDDFMSLVNSLKHVSNLLVTVNDLQTGKAADVTGSFVVKTKGTELQKWNEQNVYHYQLLDKSIKVFAPGVGNI